MLPLTPTQLLSPLLDLLGSANMWLSSAGLTVGLSSAAAWGHPASCSSAPSCRLVQHLHPARLEPGGEAAWGGGDAAAEKTVYAREQSPL